MIIPKILIVEDEFLIAKDISIILEKEGYEIVMGIASVDDAISIIEEENFSLVLIDIGLKGSKDGLFLGHYLLKKDTIPFIYVTSYSDDSTLNKVKNSRPHGIIIKPFKAIDIKFTVSLILNNFQYKNVDLFRSIENEDYNDENPFILKNVIQFIDDNIDKRIELNDLSRITKWTHHHFIKVFTKFLHKTPYQYILEKKIAKSQLLINNTKLSFREISYDLGFTSYSNFINAFKRITETTPEKYRKYGNIKNHIK
jgi:AraC-like DNA-binding protein